MTDKQIIIDGVDVSGCVYHEDGYCTISKQAYCYCCDKPNCYYKQLKRSEAQCEAMFVSHTDLEKKYKAKEQECEELKEKLIRWLGKEGIRQSEKEFYLQQLDQLKETLTEIKEIIRNQGHIDILEEQILQKISECEGKQ